MADAIVILSGERMRGGSEMLPEHMREALWRKVSQWYANEDERLKKVALWLQDAGHGDEEIMMLISHVWGVAYDAGQADADGDW